MSGRRLAPVAAWPGWSCAPFEELALTRGVHVRTPKTAAPLAREISHTPAIAVYTEKGDLMADYTSGPWHIEWADKSVEIRNAEGLLVCGFEFDERTECVEADAQLLAKAPELLEELQRGGER